MNFFKTLSSRNLNLLLAGLVVALAVMLGLAVWLTPAPKLMIEYDGATVEVFADKAWSLLPNDCLQIRWAFDGELPIHVDGREWHESGEQQFCPTIFATESINRNDRSSDEAPISVYKLGHLSICRIFSSTF